MEEQSVKTPTVLSNPGPAYYTAARHWQGIPGIERAANGRLWATWYTGAYGEGPGNHVVLVTSDDDGKSWSEPVLVVLPPAGGRMFDPCLWHDPRGRMWLFCAQSSRDQFDGRVGVWAIHCEDSGVAQPRFTAPRRLCNGIAMNKPTVLSSGEWLLPAAVWAFAQPHLPETAAERFSNVICSQDEGETWVRRGGADVPDRCFDEHMVVERRDGTLWMLVRTLYGIGESFSPDRGKSWTPGKPSSLHGPNSRFFIRRLRSGRLLLVNHSVPPEYAAHPEIYRERSHITAWVSDNDGVSWKGGLLLDPRTGVSYPDGVEAPDGRIYVIYDYQRGDKYADAINDNLMDGKAREILMAVFTEDDVLAGRCVSPGARLKVRVNRVSPEA